MLRHLRPSRPPARRSNGRANRGEQGPARSGGAAKRFQQRRATSYGRSVGIRRAGVNGEFWTGRRPGSAWTCRAARRQSSRRRPFRPLRCVCCAGRRTLVDAGLGDPSSTARNFAHSSTNNRRFWTHRRAVWGLRRGPPLSPTVVRERRLGHVRGNRCSRQLNRECRPEACAVTSPRPCAH